MNAVDTLSKGSEAAGHLASAVQKFIKSDGNVKQILSGCFDLVSALSVFLPPPYSQITGAISSIANMFLGGGSTDTATIIQTEFARQSKLILDQFENLKTFIVDELKAQTLDQMYLLAEVSKFHSQRIDFANIIQLYFFLGCAGRFIYQDGFCR